MRRALFVALLAVSFPVAAIAASGSPQPLTQVADPFAEVSPNGPASAPLSTRSRGGGDVSQAGFGRAGSKPPRRLARGFDDLLYESGDAATRNQAFNQTDQVNGGVVRLGAIWRNIAPRQPSPGFDPTDPGSPEYDWGALDTAVREASSRNLQVLLLINGAPDWAEGSNRPTSADPGTWKPNPTELKAFGTAVARRYSGKYQGLPRVRDYQLWAEPNQDLNLTPQWNGKKAVAPTIYRNMLNAFYQGVHKVDNSDRVITGGTAPYGVDPGGPNMRPLVFWRDVMCIKGRKRLKPTKCRKKAKFDVLAHHPIDTSGGPRTSAINPDDVSTPDLHNLVDVLRVAEKAKTVKPAGHRPVWATEIWWESDPPDPESSIPSLAKQAAYYSESLYLLWKQGASMVLLLQVQDEPYDGHPGRTSGNYQTGVFFSNGKPKPSARAFRFPFVVEKQSRKSKKTALIWGIAPKSGKLKVTKKGSKKTVAKLKVVKGAIFKRTIRIKGRSKFRAAVGGTRSLYWKYP